MEIESKEDAYRLQCPQGHQIAPTNNHFWCRACANHWEDIDPEYEVAVDAKTGRELTRNEIVLDHDIPGVYHA